MIDVLILLLVFSLLNDKKWLNFIAELIQRFGSKVVLVGFGNIDSNSITPAVSSKENGVVDDASVSITGDDNNTLESSDESFDTPVCSPDADVAQRCCIDGRSSESALSSSSSSTPYQRRIRRVRFSTVRVRSYSVIALNNNNNSATTTEEDSSSVPPPVHHVTQEYPFSAPVRPPAQERTVLSLDWAFAKEREIPVELFERMRCVSHTRRSHTRRSSGSSPSASSFAGKPVAPPPHHQALQVQTRQLYNC